MSIEKAAEDHELEYGTGQGFKAWRKPIYEDENLLGSFQLWQNGHEMAYNARDSCGPRSRYNMQKIQH